MAAKKSSNIINKRAVLSDGKNPVILDVVITESTDYGNTVSDNPVEDGVNISDHVKNEPIKIAISGVIVEDKDGKKLNALSHFRNKGKILTYTGRSCFNNLVIESLSTEKSKDNRYGFSFSINFKQIRIAEIKFTSLPYVKLKTTYKKTSSKTSKGKIATKTKTDASLSKKLNEYVKGKAVSK